LLVAVAVVLAKVVAVVLGVCVPVLLVIHLVAVPLQSHLLL
jgi:hypothetical protein